MENDEALKNSFKALFSGIDDETALELLFAAHEFESETNTAIVMINHDVIERMHKAKEEEEKSMESLRKLFA